VTRPGQTGPIFRHDLLKGISTHTMLYVTSYRTQFLLTLVWVANRSFGFRSTNRFNTITWLLVSLVVAAALLVSVYCHDLHMDLSWFYVFTEATDNEE